MRHLAILQARQEELRAQEAAIIAAVEASGKPATTEQTEQLAAIDAEFEGDGGLLAQISREQRRRERDMAAPAIPADEVAEAAQHAADRRATALPTPFRSFGAQLQAVARSAVSDRTDDGLLAIQAAAQGLNESIPAEGGFLVQQDVSQDLYRYIWETGTLANQTRQVPVTGSGLKLNKVDETSRADGSRMGGIQAYWTGEAATATATKPKFDRVTLDLEKLMGVYYATDELLADEAALQAEVTSWFSDEFGFKVDDAIIRGTGAAMPLGILVSPALVTQTKEGGQAANTFVAANAQKMFGRMPARSAARASWYINVEVWQQLFAMTQANNAIFLPGGNIASAPFGTLLGRPIVPIEQASALSSPGDVIFADLDQYLTIKKGGIVAATSIHVQFLTDETAFRFTMRLNGQPIWKAPLTPYKGSNTLSPFVVLEAR